MLPRFVDAYVAKMGVERYIDTGSWLLANPARFRFGRDEMVTKFEGVHNANFRYGKRGRGDDGI